MRSRKKLRAEIRALRLDLHALEGQIAQTSREAHFAEMVCRCAGQLLDPANKYVVDNRRESLEEAYKCWVKEVPTRPYRGIFCIGKTPEWGVWPRVEYKDREGYWHLLISPERTAESGNEGGEG